MQNPLVSILIPFKNTASFLDECINSIINQTYKNWELIIIDDHSSDNGYSQVNSFAKKDARIKLFKNSGIGIIDALQLAFSRSSGDLITRMDSDDIMRSEKIETLVNNLLKYGKQHVAIGLVNYFSKEGVKSGFKSYEVWLNTLTKTGANYSDIYKECSIPSPCWMVYKDDLVSVDGFNPNRYPEDYDLAFRFYKHGFKCIPCSTILHDWRDYNTRTSRTHIHYAENYFIDLKLHYFLELDFDKNKTLVLWGAGNKGKKIAKILIEKDIDFEWICDNPKKIGKDIYGKIMCAFSYLKTVKNPQSIITVANKIAQEEIKVYLKSLHLINNKGYFFFC